MSGATDVETLTGEKADHVVRMAARAFEKAGLGDPKAGYLSTMLYVADREFNVNFSIFSHDGAVEHRIFVLAHTWGCMVRKRVKIAVRTKKGRRYVFELENTDEVLEVHFKGDWDRYKADSVLLAMAFRNTEGSTSS